MELGIRNDIPTYSGGLGVLAGDVIRSSADLMVPMVAVTLVSRNGYLKQKITPAGDQLEFPDKNPDAKDLGIHPQLAALEMLIYPKSSQLLDNNKLAQSGSLEIVPVESSLSLFIWSKNRIIPVRLTDFSVTEEFFDTSLNPIRAKVSLGMRVLSVNDLGFDHKGGQLYLAYHQQKEKFAGMSKGGAFGDLGVGGI